MTMLLWGVFGWGLLPNLLPGDITSNIGRDVRITLFMSTARRTSVPAELCGTSALGITPDDPDPSTDKGDERLGVCL